MTVLLQLDGVSKFYGALKAVDAVNLTVGDGEALGVIGPNGAGKSTMFNLITGDVAPTAGRVAVRRHRHDGDTAARALAHGDRTLLSDTASVREHDRVRESVGRRDLRRPHQRARELQALQRRAENHGPLRQSQQAGAHADAASAQTPGTCARLGHPTEASAARRDRRRSDRARMRRIGQNHQGNSRGRHDDRLDRAHRARVGLGRRAGWS